MCSRPELEATATAVLGDLIDLAQDNSVRWPTPRPIPLVHERPQGAPPRRHYLRVSGEPHIGLERRVESLVRRLGLSVQNRAARNEPGQTHLGFLLSPANDQLIAALARMIARLGRVKQQLVLGVTE